MIVYMRCECDGSTKKILSRPALPRLNVHYLQPIEADLTGLWEEVLVSSVCRIRESLCY